MKKLFAIFMLAFATVASAGAQAIDTSKLSKAQIAELAAKAEAMGATTPANVSATVRKEAEAWGDLGANMGKAMVGAAKEVGVAANEFASTPLGRVTVVITAYKIIGRDILKLVFGSLVLFVGWSLGIWILVTRRWSNVKYEYEPIFWGMIKKSRVISHSTESDVATTKAIIGSICLVVASVTGLNIIF